MNQEIKALEKSYGWKSDSNEPSHAYLLPAALRILKFYDVNNLLDVGCGNGSSLPAWLSSGLKVSAIEPDQQGYEYSKLNSSVEVRKLGVGDALPDHWINNFDALISLEVVEHLFDPYLLIDTADEALNENGLIILSTPFHGYIKNLAMSITNKWDFHHHPQRTGGHIKFWSKKTLSALFTDRGYSIEHFEGVGRIPFLWKSMFLTFKKVNI